MYSHQSTAEDISVHGICLHENFETPKWTPTLSHTKIDLVTSGQLLVQDAEEERFYGPDYAVIESCK